MVLVRSQARRPNTIVGREIVAKGAPDGFTFLITTNSDHTQSVALTQAAVRSRPRPDPGLAGLAGTILIVAKGGRPTTTSKACRPGERPGRPATYGSWGYRLERTSLWADARERWAASTATAVSRRRAGPAGRRHADSISPGEPR